MTHSNKLFEFKPSKIKRKYIKSWKKLSNCKIRINDNFLCDYFSQKSLFKKVSNKWNHPQDGRKFYGYKMKLKYKVNPPYALCP